MKKVLFAWIYPIDPKHGGVERVTSVIMAGLKDRGHICNNIICDENEGCFYINNEISEENRIPFELLSGYLNKQAYDIIVCQDACSQTITKIFKELSPPFTKILTFLHFSPTHWAVIYSCSALLCEVKIAETLKEKMSWIFRLLIHWFWYKRALNKIKEIYKSNYQYSNKFIVLSKTFYPQLLKILGVCSSDKLVAIPNPLSYPLLNSTDLLNQKKKEVLIVSRLDERQKKVSFALRVWSIVQKKGYNDWTLKIVGYGPAEHYLKSLIISKKIPNIRFEGWQKPDEYYKNASIFMMTSETEGWGVTLTEAQQMGVVPIARDSYSSLHDIITDGFDGIIVPPNDVNMYAIKLMYLMDNIQVRERLALHGLESVKRFTADKIVNCWEELFNTL